MKRNYLIIIMGLLLTGTSAMAQTKSPKHRKADKVKADTSCRNEGDMASWEAMMQQMDRQSRQMAHDMMGMFGNLTEGSMPSQGMLDSMVEMHKYFFNDDSTGNHHKFRHRGRKAPRSMAQQLYFTKDSTGGKSQSIQVISRDGKTTIIRNGKDTTVVDGPFIPERDAPDLGMGSIDRFDFTMPSLPDFDGFPSIPDFDATPSMPQRFAYRMQAPRTPSVIESETPSEQEIEMLTKKGLANAKELESALPIEDVTINPNARNKTLTLRFTLEGSEQAAVVVANPDGTTIERATLRSNGGEFRRTLKLDSKSSYIYVVIKANGAASSFKFWL